MDELDDIVDHMDSQEELLGEVCEFLRKRYSHYFPINGPMWYRDRWILEYEGKSPREAHEAIWVEVDFEYMEITLRERKNGKSSSMDFSLYEEDCFERLANVARDAALGKF